MSQEADDHNFQALLGAFGSHANVERRARAERRAGMAVNDKRRKKRETRNTPLNTRVRKSVSDLAKALCEAEGISQADLLEQLIEKAAKAKGIK
ncbi:RepB family protein [Hyphomicrobium sulfonivorans]|uniref:RepB family protein n=1 Tax=Hyphomicrobium sulfonivorans TaxID=121290 RepID=UPI00156D6CBB|nr:RepB family protein [Hyphomicrobium sulfonivorans]MBI1650134.1 hypothetical protein [Hyphomicrobium sulfonivorans]NSL73049.1 hypothetical protein [Hyphomicrobium sulfonivorans]